MRSSPYRALRSTARTLLERLGLRQRTSFALNALDLQLLPHLSPRTRGFFVEAGGNDGLAQSNTAYLERYLGWRGLLIEPIPSLAQKCRANRPRARVEQCALVPFDFPDSDIEMQFCNLMSIVAGARGSAEADAAHLRAGKAYLATNQETYTVRVPAKPLSAVLDSQQISHIDLLSLDVEGFEAQALSGLDFERHAPTLILVEANRPEDIDAILRPRYELAAALSHHDKLYRLRAERG